MSKIESHSIFGHYKQLENRVTAAFLQILKNGGTEFIGKVISEIDEIDFPSSEINIITQEREQNNVYDGLLECNFSFKVIVESKIRKEEINEFQLDGLIENASGPNDYILYLTPDEQKPEQLQRLYQEKPIYWCNWKKLNQILKELNPHTEPLNFLILEFEKYLDFLNLLEDPQNRVQIVAGSYGEPVALKYGFYACQNYRTFKESKYLAFYNRGNIQTLFEIVGVPQNDYDLLASTNPNVIDYLKEYEPNYSTSEKRQFYQLKLIKKNLNIIHTGLNKNNKRSAYTMGVFRYTSIDKLLKAKTTDEL